MTCFGIYHRYTEIGNFMEPVEYEDLLFVTDSEETAKAYADRWGNNHATYRPDTVACRGKLVVKKLPAVCITRETLATPPWELVKGSADRTRWLRISFDRSCR